ncbi:hypothetical protein O181_022903 [Austropuccinia psidii MF-1]|uniref:Uncharacterized protein n=1 Tax=Austropuccinia psidii MF-1 TaxID=1389203 RepID=A0A9Q3GWT8_9BASI|nr:hypothetical protein [Austropuccinia psidii MF-1]
MQQTTDENMSLPNESIVEKTDLFDNESMNGNTCKPVPPVEEQQTNRNDKTPRLKVIVLCHPILITRGFHPLHILPYSRRPTAYLTESEKTPSTYHGALKLNNKLEWVKVIEKELLTIDKVDVWDVIDLKKKY